jgi:hypothetical protein
MSSNEWRIASLSTRRILRAAPLAAAPDVRSICLKSRVVVSPSTARSIWTCPDWNAVSIFSVAASVKWTQLPDACSHCHLPCPTPDDEPAAVDFRDFQNDFMATLL